MRSVLLRFRGGGRAGRLAAAVPSTRAARRCSLLSHYSLLATTKQVLGPPTLGNAATAKNLVAFFGLSPVLAGRG